MDAWIHDSAQAVGPRLLATEAPGNGTTIVPANVHVDEQLGLVVIPSARTAPKRRILRAPGHNTGVLSECRRSEFNAIRDAIKAWASTNDEIVGALLVGSWARGSARMDSDIDVVVITESEQFVESETWIADVVDTAAELVRTGDWGALVERRVRLASGIDIEFGFVKPSWTRTDPIDPGTRRVVTDGCEIWYDPEGYLARLVATAG